MDESKMRLVECGWDERPDVAAWLLATATSLGISTKVVQTRNAGFLVPAELLDGLATEPSFVPDLAPDPHHGELNLAKVVEIVKEVRAELAAEPDRETVREWAKAQGLPVAERGALKKSLTEAYLAAQP